MHHMIHVPNVLCAVQEGEQREQAVEDLKGQSIMLWALDALGSADAAHLNKGTSAGTAEGCWHASDSARPGCREWPNIAAGS